MSILTLSFGMAGLLAGGLFCSQLTRWMLLLHVTAKKHSGDFLGTSRRRLLWALPLVVVFHPGFWLLCLVLVATARTLAVPDDERWIWFLAGFYFFVVFTAVPIAAVLRKARRNRVPNTEHGRDRADA
jgi:hypothetical protein